MGTVPWEAPRIFLCCIGSAEAQTTAFVRGGCVWRLNDSVTREKSYNTGGFSDSEGPLEAPEGPSDDRSSSSPNAKGERGRGGGGKEGMKSSSP